MSSPSTPASNDNPVQLSKIMADWRDAVNAQALDDLLELYAEDAKLLGTFAPSVVNDHEGRKAYFVDNGARLQGVEFHDDFETSFQGDGSVNYTGTYTFTGEDGTERDATFLFNTVANSLGEQVIRVHVSRPALDESGNPNAETAAMAYEAKLG